VTSYKYLGIDLHHKLNWNYIIKKRIIGGWKSYCGLENNCKSTSIFEVGIRRNSCLRLFLLLLFFMDLKFGVVVSLVNPGEI
jgi:hypothetical protein